MIKLFWCPSLRTAPSGREDFSAASHEEAAIKASQLLGGVEVILLQDEDGWFFHGMEVDPDDGTEPAVVRVVGLEGLEA
jgi:hypothetical protein